MKANGSGLTDITPLNLPAIQDLDWSPDGQHIAFDAVAGHVFQIFTVEADGSGLGQLTFRDGGASSPSWSPDGKIIMFEATSPDILGKIDLSNEDKPVPQIYIMKPDGSDIRRFTVRTKADNIPMIGSYRRDGLISVSERDTRTAAITYIVDSDGGIQKQFPELPSYFPLDWSPDGNFILTSAPRTDCSQVVIMKFDGTGQRCLVIGNKVNPPVYAGSASWSPNGDFIIFTANLENNNGVGNLYVMKLDGSELTQLTFFSSEVGDAVWSVAP